MTYLLLASPWSSTFVVVQLLRHVWLLLNTWLQQTRTLYPSLFPQVCSDSCPLSQWCYLTVSSSAIPFFCLQCFPASQSFPVSWFFASGGLSIRASASVLSINIQGWFPLGCTGYEFLIPFMRALPYDLLTLEIRNSITKFWGDTNIQTTVVLNSKSFSVCKL